ncbi:MAG: hypothetical protein ACLFOY_06025 [Desulfatibacillaceae bacterium]
MERLEDWARSLPPRVPEADEEGRPVVSPRYPYKEARFGPMRVNRLSGGADLIDLNRIDMDPVRFDQVTLAAAGLLPGGAASRPFLLFYVEGRPRPFLADAGNSDFRDFPGVAATSITDTVRNFLSLIRSRNPDLLVDQATHRFAQGAPPPAYESPENVSTALGYFRASVGSAATGASKQPAWSSEQTRRSVAWTEAVGFVDGATQSDGSTDDPAIPVYPAGEHSEPPPVVFYGVAAACVLYASAAVFVLDLFGVLPSGWYRRLF